MYRHHRMVANTYMAKASPPLILYRYWPLRGHASSLDTALDYLAIYVALDIRF